MKLRLVLLFFWLVILLGNTATILWMLVCIIVNSDRAVKIAVAYDKLGNVALGHGYETISSHAGRNNTWMEKPINWLFKILTGEENHCDKWVEK